MDELSYSMQDPGGIVYPETISTLNTQPMLTFVELYIGETKLTISPPRYLVSFEMIKLTSDGGSQFTLVFFDENWEELEYIISRNQTDVSIRYGFVNGKQSPRYNVILGDYAIEFLPSGTMLSISGITKGAYTNLNNITLDTGTLNPTEAAKEICRAAGWQVFDKNFEPSMNIESYTRDSFSLVGERPATYIINKLAPLAISEQGRGGYRFYLDDTVSPPIAYFRSLIISPNTIRTYVHMKGIDSPILDLTLKVEGVWGGSTGGSLVTTGYSSSFIDAETKEVHNAAETINSSRVDVPGGFSATRNDQYTSVVDAAGSTKSQMDAVLRYHLSPGNVHPYKGTMVIIGDPELYPYGDEALWIRLIVITKNGNLHHCSGLYFIEGASDNIQDGIMTTSLSLTRSASLDGPEAIEYKILHK